MILKTELMSHQADAFNKVSRNRVGALFMEMGTGKSRVAIELISMYLGVVTKTIWITPVNARQATADEISKHADGLSCYVFSDSTESGSVPDADVYIVGSESVSQSDRAYLALRSIISGALVILDESHLFKSPWSKRTRRMIELSRETHARYLLTGTPMSKGFEDLYSQFHFLSPKILGYKNFNHFAHYHLDFEPGKRGKVTGRRYKNYVTTKISPYVYQVKKSECLELPEKTYSDRQFSLTQDQKRYYSQIKEHFLNTMEAWEEETGVIVYKLFSSLQQVCSGAYSVEGKFFDIFDEPTDNPRIKVMLGLDRELPKDAQIIVWAKYTREINQLSSVLSDRYGRNSVAMMHGGLSQKERQENLKSFRTGARFLVANPATGGVALTLNEASYAVFYSQTFKYIERVQAEDRCHRIGQDKNVHYITIHAESGIEDIISRCLSNREDAVKSFSDEVNRIRKLKDKKKAEREIKKMREKL